MATDVAQTLRKALEELQAEKKRIETQIAAIQGALAVSGRQAAKDARPKSGEKRGRRAMSAAQRKVVGRRMKAYWAKRKAEVVTAKTKSDDEKK
jgi:hypothetical protein